MEWIPCVHPSDDAPERLRLPGRRRGWLRADRRAGELRIAIPSDGAQIGDVALDLPGWACKRTAASDV